ncbi:6761_t:CDS:1, partial [Gigaspora margarita]
VNINSSISPSDLIDLELDDSVPQELSLESLEKINVQFKKSALISKKIS